MKILVLSCIAAMIVACGGKSGGAGTDGGGTGSDGGGTVIDSGGGTVDASIDAFFGCTSAGVQCANCIDDDSDGRIDGFDIECTGPADNDEASFATGIPGDNKDRVNQDCFFDGDSGAGNDGCNIHVCCLLGATTRADCPIGANQFDPASCATTVTTECIQKCGAVTPAGCDCFGCCTICDSADPSVCRDVTINQVISPNCTSETLADPTKCTACTKNALCDGGSCNTGPGTPDACVLCPGQDPNTLPPECNGMTTCPNGEQTCTGDAMCPAGNYCSNGCCIGVIF